MDMARRTVEEWQQHLGQQVRRLRLQADMSQATLAERADVSEPTIRNLEAGKGSSLATIIRVTRALGRQDWLEELSPPIEISPIQMLRDREREHAQTRRRAGRS